mgnify:CR=1 FL=1
MSTFTEALDLSPENLKVKTGIFGLQQDELDAIVKTFTSTVPISEMVEKLVRDFLTSSDVVVISITEEMAKAIIKFTDDLLYTDVQKGIIVYKMFDAVHNATINALRRAENSQKLKSLDALIQEFEELLKKVNKTNPENPEQN